MMFETALGVDAETLIRLQMKYNMRIVRRLCNVWMKFVSLRLYYSESLNNIILTGQRIFLVGKLSFKRIA